jgi:hypothetical protein
MGLPADQKTIKHDLANKKYAQLFMDLLHKPGLDMGMACWWQAGLRLLSAGYLGFAPLRRLFLIGPDPAVEYAEIAGPLHPAGRQHARRLYH